VAEGVALGLIVCDGAWENRGKPHGIRHENVRLGKLLAEPDEENQVKWQCDQAEEGYGDDKGGKRRILWKLAGEWGSGAERSDRSVDVGY